MHSFCCSPFSRLRMRWMATIKECLRATALRPGVLWLSAVVVVLGLGLAGSLKLGAGPLPAQQTAPPAPSVPQPRPGGTPIPPMPQPRPSGTPAPQSSPQSRQSGPATGQATPSGSPATQPSQAGPPAPGSLETPPSAQTTPAGQVPPTTSPALAGETGVGFRLENADLLQFINLVGAELKINYVVDPAVKGSVTISTGGRLNRADLLPILESVLEINGATAVPTGNFYRIVPLKEAPKVPLEVRRDTSAQDLARDDRMVMEIIPLRFVPAGDMSKMLSPFLSDGGAMSVHESGNVLVLVDNSLNVKRLMEILEQFDSPAFAQERVHLVPVQNNLASALIPELEAIFSAYALNAKESPLRFLPLDRINAILVVAADPGAFEEVDKWVAKLDLPATPSGVQAFVYRVQNSEAAYLSQLLAKILAKKSSSSTPEAVISGEGTETRASGAGNRSSTRGGPPALGLGMDETEEGQVGDNLRIVPDPVNNSLIIVSTPAQFADVAKTLNEIDVLPRQVLLEARVYEVDLTGALSFGLEYALQQRGAGTTPLQFLGDYGVTTSNTLTGSTGIVVGTRQLMGFLTANENRQNVKILSAPSILATDNTEAQIQVGEQVPVLTSTGAASGVQVGGSTTFLNTIQNVDTGIILRIKPRITSTDLVSLEISQDVTAVVPAGSTGIQSPSFSKRSIKTHAVVKDGETISLGGLISYNINNTINRIPLLGDIPILGALFGSTSHNVQKTEMFVLLSPRIIKTNQDAVDASKELRDKLKDLRLIFKKDQMVNPREPVK
ncbi:putative Type II and III secretion system protein [Acidobacteriia bacterium SbA2]|nr:putative Type II and III secretion system protein [Acidobacteriia bacterium SbA2]